jgi:hypothetical protein
MAPQELFKDGKSRFLGIIAQLSNKYEAFQFLGGFFAIQYFGIAEALNRIFFDLF